MSKSLRFLTLSEMLRRKAIDFIQSFNPIVPAVPEIDIKGYTMISDLTKMSSGTNSVMGAFRNDKTKETVFIKKYYFKTQGLRYGSLLNEVSILKLLGQKKLLRFPQYHVLIPGLLKAKLQKKEITLICEYQQGTPLLESSQAIKIKTITQVLQTIKEISQQLGADLGQLPVRRNSVLAGSFLYFWTVAAWKNPHCFRECVALFGEYYKNYFASWKDSSPYGLAHRDLHSRNILLRGSQIVLTDWEGVTRMDSTYDLAMIGRLYFKEFSRPNFFKLFDQLLNTETEKNRFVMHSIFHCVQTLAVDATDTPSYQPTQEYLLALLHDIIPNILNLKK